MPFSIHDGQIVRSAQASITPAACQYHASCNLHVSIMTAACQYRASIKLAHNCRATGSLQQRDTGVLRAR